MSENTERPVPKRLSIIQLLALVGGLVVLVAGTVLFGQTSHSTPTGSAQGAIEAANEYYRLAGYPVDAMTFNAEISTVDKFWAKFTATPSIATAGLATYGYEHFSDHHWGMVANGTSDVGCPTAVASGSVPLVVIEGFGLTCSR